SVGNIKKITKTMEMVSVSKMRRAVERALASRSYAHYALELLVNLSKDKNVTHPLMNAGKSNKELLIVIASNKGLCGGYHSNLLKALNVYLKDEKTKNPAKEIKAVTIGKYGEKICKKSEIPLFASFITFSEYSTIEQVQELSNLVTKEFIEGDYASVKILYTEFLKSTTYKPVLRELFPLSIQTVENVVDAITETEKTEVDENSLVDYKFEPDLNLILDSILPGLVDIVVYQSLAEAFASEHSARMFAMKNAGDSATTILENLVLSYNHARQNGITTELSEIVAGAEALSSD
ncbi:MAG TPA: ATP synthase F1 subunit gamma, partial [Candidatus Paceibacterota bacterium]|nr:ATP synthase F1 subunit gamma [Candidatus Paceibacterota bacterium]